MSWNESLNQFGLTVLPTPVQDSSLQTSQQYSPASIPATVLSGSLVSALQIGNPNDTTGNNSIYLDSQGIYAGSSVFATAPFSVDLQGNVIANSLTITGYIPVGGAASDVNSHVVTISGGKITANSITAAQIAANTITAGQIAANTITASQIAANTITASQIASATITGTQIAGTTITASNIVSGTITGTQIAATTITATNLNVSTLSAISANLGTVTAGSISGVTITGTTVIGGTIETSTTGQRVVITGSGNSVDFYDSGGTFTGSVSGSTTGGHSILISGDTLITNSSFSQIATTGTNISMSSGGGNIDLTPVGGNVRIFGNISVIAGNFSTSSFTTTATTIGFFGAGSGTIPNITGSRAGNAALQSLLHQLQNLGLIIDSST